MANILERPFQVSSHVVGPNCHIQFYFTKVKNESTFLINTEMAYDKHYLNDFQLDSYFVYVNDNI